MWLGPTAQTSAASSEPSKPAIWGPAAAFLKKREPITSLSRWAASLLGTCGRLVGDLLELGSDITLASKAVVVCLLVEADCAQRS